MATKRQKDVWRSEINNIIRGVCGGFLFGIPLLYTMDVWWIRSLAKSQLMMMADRIYAYRGVLAQSDRRLSETQISLAG